VAVAALQPIVYDEATLGQRMAAPSVSHDLEQLRLGDVHKVMRLLDDNLHPIQRTRFQEARLNTDDNVFLEHQLPWDTFHGHVVQLRPKAKAAAQRSPRNATYVRPVTTRSVSPVQRSSAAVPSAAVPSATVPSATAPPTPRAR
jgi:hypothetical protein